MTRFTRLARRGPAVLAGAAVLALTLGACSAAPAPSDPDAPVVLDVWGWNPDEASAPGYFDAFEAENEGITVNYRFIQYSDYVNATRLAATTKDGPDVFGLQAGVLPEQFAPLTEDLAPYMSELVGSDWDSQLQATDQFEIDGKQVAVPWFMVTAGFMWANQTVVDELGLSIPTTLEELKAFNAAAEAAGKTGLVVGAKDGWQNLDLFQVIANQIEPGAFYDAMEGTTDFDSAVFVQAFDAWKALFDEGVIPEGALGVTAYPDANDARLKGEAALIGFGSSQYRDTTNGRMAQYAETYGVPAIADTRFMPYPFPALVEGGTTGSLFGGPDVGWAVSAQSEQKDAAAKLVAWLTTSDTGVGLLGDALRPAALKGSELNLSDVKTPEQVTAVEDFVTASETIVGPREIANADVKEALINALSGVAAGTTDPKDAAQAVQAVLSAAQ